MIDNDTVYYFEFQTFEEVHDFLKYLDENTNVRFNNDIRNPLTVDDFLRKMSNHKGIIKVYNNKVIYNSLEGYKGREDHEESKKQKLHLFELSVFPNNHKYEPYPFPLNIYDF